MRSFGQFLKDIIRKPPIIFPLVGLFHLLWLIYLIWDDRHEPFPDIVWLQVLWMAGFTLFWLAACDLRRWGAIGYVLLTVADGCIYLAITQKMLPYAYQSNLFLIDGLLSIVLLYYFKRFK